MNATGMSRYQRAGAKGFSIIRIAEGAVKGSAEGRRFRHTIQLAARRVDEWTKKVAVKKRIHHGDTEGTELHGEKRVREFER